jgi:hypothetical protein
MRSSGAGGGAALAHQASRSAGLDGMTAATRGSIYPASTWIDCSLPGDHCRLFGDYEIDLSPAGSTAEARQSHQ